MLKISAKNLIEAIEAGHKAVALARAPGVNADIKESSLRQAAGLLCDQLRTAASDATYWRALEVGDPHPEAQSVVDILGDLLDDKDNRRHALNEIYRQLGYRPEDEIEETVRGMISAAYAGAVLGVGASSIGHARQSQAMAIAGARFSLELFSAQFCAAEQHLRKPLGARLREHAAKDMEKRIVSAMFALSGVLGTLTLGYVREHLPPAERERICSIDSQSSKSIKTTVLEYICALPKGGVASEAQAQAQRAEDAARIEVLKADLVQSEQQREDVLDELEALKQRLSADEREAFDRHMEALRRGPRPRFRE